jgi:hypothetical protein
MAEACRRKYNVKPIRCCRISVFCLNLINNETKHTSKILRLKTVVPYEQLITIKKNLYRSFIILKTCNFSYFTFCDLII